MSVLVGIERFDSKVVADGDCLIWTAGKSGSGYGVFDWKRRSVSAHRFAYTMIVGPIPEGLQVDHLCHRRLCVNPAHLRCVTAKENIANAPNHSAQRTHCPRGHKYSHRNINGDRCCAICARKAATRYRARRRAAV